MLNKHKQVFDLLKSNQELLKLTDKELGEATKKLLKLFNMK